MPLFPFKAAEPQGSEPFVPPAPQPRRKPPSRLQTIRIVARNPLELWSEAAFSEPWVTAMGARVPVVIANDPGLIRHVLVDNAQNYKLATLRQKVLKPMLRDGLLTAEGDTWKRSRKAMAPVFTPRHIFGFAPAMRARAETFAARFDQAGSRDIAQDMTALTYEILADTLFSGEIAGQPGRFAAQTNRLFETMGRIDPLDILRAPEWLPRLTRLRGRRVMNFFRGIVSETIAMRERAMRRGDRPVPEDFLSLLLRARSGPAGLTRDEVEDNLITFIGAGHETTARALGWTLYCLSQAPGERERVEAEVDRLAAAEPDPAKWLEAMPFTRAAFEEALRLYPPAPSINREPVATDTYKSLTLPKGAAVLVMPWTVHRHRGLWQNPDAYLPERFHPGNRETIDKHQFLPFGAGPRVCIGASFAMQEAVIVLAVLLRRFRFDMTPGAPHPWPVQKLTTQPQGGIWMRVLARA